MKILVFYNFHLPQGNNFLENPLPLLVILLLISSLSFIASFYGCGTWKDSSSFSITLVLGMGLLEQALCRRNDACLSSQAGWFPRSTCSLLLSLLQLLPAKLLLLCWSTCYWPPLLCFTMPPHFCTISSQVFHQVGATLSQTLNLLALLKICCHWVLLLRAFININSCYIYRFSLIKLYFLKNLATHFYSCLLPRASHSCPK